jgi:hypothetical protein
VLPNPDNSCAYDMDALASLHDGGFAANIHATLSERRASIKLFDTEKPVANETVTAPVGAPWRCNCQHGGAPEPRDCPRSSSRRGRKTGESTDGCCPDLLHHRVELLTFAYAIKRSFRFRQSNHGPDRVTLLELVFRQRRAGGLQPSIVCIFSTNSRRTHLKFHLSLPRQLAELVGSPRWSRGR